MAGQLTIDTLKASSGVLATQNGMTGIAKAWVQFAGSTGTIAGSFNVSSITRNTTGDFTVNFTTAMPNANYAALTTAGSGSATVGFAGSWTSAPTASSFRFVTTSLSAATDYAYTMVAVFSS